MRNIPSTQKAVTLFFLSSSGPFFSITLLFVLLISRIAMGGISGAEAVLPPMLLCLRGPLEWLSHYYVFHENRLPLLGLRFRSRIAAMHREHHRCPKDVDGMLFGWKSLAIGSAVLFTIFFALSGSLQWAITLLFSALLPVTVYDYFHLLAHSDVDAEDCWFPSIINNHRDHHERVRRDNMGVSSILGDWMFGRRE